MRGKPLKVNPSMIIIDGADPVPLDSLTPEQRKEVNRKWNERLTAVFTEYLTQYPEQWDHLVEAD